jgi:hypothetical protein
VEYARSTIFVTGVAKIAKDDPIASSNQVFFVSIIVDEETGLVVDATCNTVREMTENFIRLLLVGKNLATGVDEMVQEIRQRFFGLVQKTLIVALKDAHNRFMVLRKDKDLRSANSS